MIATILERVSTIRYPEFWRFRCTSVEKHERSENAKKISLQTHILPWTKTVAHEQLVQFLLYDFEKTERSRRVNLVEEGARPSMEGRIR